jgi:hypothetical protein
MRYTEIGDCGIRPLGDTVMTAMQIHLDQAHVELLRSLAETTGKPADDVVQEGLELMAEKVQSSPRILSQIGLPV